MCDHVPLHSSPVIDTAKDAVDVMAENPKSARQAWGFGPFLIRTLD